MSDQTPPKDLLDWLGISNAPNWRVAKPLGHLVAALLTLLILIAFAAAFVLLVSTIFGSTANGAGSLSAGALIVAILGAPFLIWNTVIKQTTVNFQKESHITDRISKAVEQLGAEKTVKRLNDQGQSVETTEPNIEVRIGGLLSLERIAQDSTRYDKGRDHVRVMEILCAYVRENAPASEAENAPFPSGTKQEDLELKAGTSPFDWFYRQAKPRSDIQFALFILGRRSAEQIDIERQHLNRRGESYYLDLTETNLRKADLEGLDFSSASFFKSKLEGAFCNDADFKGCNLIYAQMTCASGRGLDLSHARIDSADFSHAILNEAKFLQCSMSHTHFVGTQLKGAHLCFSPKPQPGTVNRAFFINADLQSALIEGDVRQVYFTFRLLPDEQHPRELRATRFRNSILVDNFVFFGEAQSQSTFSPEELAVTFGEASCELKDALHRPAHWPDWELDWATFQSEWRKWQADPDTYTPPPKPTP